MIHLEREKTGALPRNLRPHAEHIYRSLFPGCEIKRLRGERGEVHVLDQHYGIDLELHLPSGCVFTAQEKYRDHRFLVERRLRVDPECPDFTQEYKNAVGTPYEREGEWFHLAAQLYFYGWANETQTEFAYWILLDVARYKLIVNRIGLETIGRRMRNQTHGRAEFFAIPVNSIRKAVLADSDGEHGRWALKTLREERIRQEDSPSFHFDA